MKLEDRRAKRSVPVRLCSKSLKHVGIGDKTTFERYLEKKKKCKGASNFQTGETLESLGASSNVSRREAQAMTRIR